MAKPTLPLMLPKIVCALLSPIPPKREGDGSLFALSIWRRNFRLNMVYKIGFMRQLLCYGEVARFKKCSNLLIKLQLWLTFLWTTFVLVSLSPYSKKKGSKTIGADCDCPRWIRSRVTYASHLKYAPDEIQNSIFLPLMKNSHGGGVAKCTDGKNPGHASASYS